ncbi:predicted dehydrogenase [Terrimicrobium sacchariphilum]|uniref:Predicted dehydrogenase n=1 Tax=Terrimicrobium sacchariphilum TaxID=690879 RepID=A0A146G4D6_TERSA|nr:Gfo/Idh/MocA family oxidoreductase [Terrimicrobium sacchariphilum]GAT32655.1 predicted dehydrogenase [Terrimicrobium sacchariphilum]
MSTPVKIGIIGGGLMGREVASALARWFVLDGFPVRAELTAVCDLAEKQREWFRQIPSVRLLTADHRELLSSPEVDVVYVAVPHNLHESIYLDVLNAGKDLFAEKPFGLDLAAARTIAEAARASGRFVRCSSEFPFLPGPQRVYHAARTGAWGKVLEIRSGFHHSSDLDPTKPANWKRQVRTCGEIGVMGDLGMHAVHLPFRLGWKPKRVYAQLQKIYLERPDGKGGMTPCDTWDNALLHTDVEIDGRDVPARFEMKRLAPGETNTWFIEILGTDGGIRYSTKEPKTLWTFQRGKEQLWQRTDLGFHGPFPTITGGIFEPGFPDCFMQMWAAFLSERAGLLGEKFGCVTPEEAVLSHELFDAALRAHTGKAVVPL